MPKSNKKGLSLSAPPATQPVFAESMVVIL